MSEDRSARYERVHEALGSAGLRDSSFETRLERFVDALWSEFGNHQPVSWVGYYHLGSDEMTLGPRRDKPACSPIGLHGACGRAALSGRSLLVLDVRELGADYIACDPRDLAELVVPVRDSTGAVVGVLDLDSYTTGAFDARDQMALEELVRRYLS